MLLTRQYLSKEGEEHIKTFKYQGDDPSYMYKYYNSPIAEFVLKHFIPRWLAPNVITVIGFCFTLTIHFLFFYYTGGEMKADYYPPWLFIAAIVSLFLYTLFDNLDGKQARRTGTSTVLGATMDHALDCLNAGVIGITLISSINMQNTKGYYSMAICGFMPFFTAAWEEYHVGGMFMPVINGPNEGVLAIQIFHFLSYLYGHQWWHVETFFGLQRAEFFILWSIFQAQLISVQNMIRVATLKSTMSIFKRFRQLTMLAFFILCLILIQLCSPTDIAVRKGRWIIYFFLFGWAKCVTLIHVWYGANQPLNLVRPSVVIPYAVFTANSVLGYFLGACPVDEDTLLYIGVVVMFLVYAHFAASIARHLADILGVKIFSITDTPKDKKN